MFKKILIANRGEIALRVIHACRELGIATVAVYSEADARALHVRFADEAVCIGPPVASESYLNVAAIVGAAEITGADAIHPGYGFLSENSRFSRACAEAGITFVGPPPELLEALGDKTAARRLARQAGVPTVPGTGVVSEDPRRILHSAESVGYPLIVKASFGGGGRGMRVVNSPDELVGRLEEARGEAQRTFGDGSVFMERYVSRARHIEVQILADSHGSVVHLWERDCSVQRRHQKVVELAPAPNLPDDLRDEICEAAIRVDEAAAAGEEGALAQIAVLRPLHRVMYVPLNDYHPDPGIAAGPLPGLAAGRILAGDAGSDRRGFAAPVLVRERNRLIEAVDEALFMARWATAIEELDQLREILEHLVEREESREGDER